MSPHVRVLLIEAAITITTGVVLYGAVAYGPELAAAGLAAWRRYNAPPLPMFPLNEPAVSDFRASLGEPIPSLLEAENWGW